MSVKKKSYAAKIRQKLRKGKTMIDPLLEGQLGELERLENIRDVLYRDMKTARLWREVYNDYNSDLVNLFRTAKYHRPGLQQELSGLLNSWELSG